MQLELAKYSAEGARAKYFWGRFLTEGDFQEEQEYNLPKADEKFKDAAMKIEQGDLNGAKASAATAAQEYRRAALEVFQNVVLRDARNELAKKDSTISDPQFQEARVELDQIEEYIINQSTVVFSIGELFAEVFDRAQDALTLTGVSGREIEKPDLHIGEIEFSPQHPEAGEQVIISAEIANVGQNAAEKIFIKLLDDEGNEIGQEVIESLDKGNSTKVTFPYTPGKAGNWRVILWVDPEDLIPENIELNNKGSNVIPVVNFKWTHTKDLKKFSKKELFLSSDNYWRNVLKLVPLTTWREVPTIDKVQKYPFLIFHQEGKNFDADAVIRFIQQYQPTHISIFEDIPQNLEKLLIASNPTGAGLNSSQLSKYKMNQYLSFWSVIERVVISEDDYETALMASVLASHLNAPLLFDGQVDSTVLDNKYAYVVGNISQQLKSDIKKRCKTSKEKTVYSLDELRKEYVKWTGTDKVILVNHNDLKISYNKEFTPEKSAKIDTMHSKHSLAAPILAAAKSEVIISNKSIYYHEIDDYVENAIESLKLSASPSYLTIVANPLAIPMARENRKTKPALWGNKVVFEEIDPSEVTWFCSGSGGYYQ
jgi:hypothetical protein